MMIVAQNKKYEIRNVINIAYHAEFLEES